MADQTKSLWIQSLERRGSGVPTGLSVSRVIPSVPSFLTDESEWQLMQEDVSDMYPFSECGFGRHRIEEASCAGGGKG